MFGYSNKVPGLSGDAGTPTGIVVDSNGTIRGVLSMTCSALPNGGNAITISLPDGGIGDTAIFSYGGGASAIGHQVYLTGTAAEAMMAFANGSNSIGLDAQVFSTDSIAVKAKADDTSSFALDIEGKIKTDQSKAQALTAYSGKAVPIYDVAGAFIGYIPLWA